MNTLTHQSSFSARERITTIIICGYSGTTDEPGANGNSFSCTSYHILSILVSMNIKEYADGILKPNGFGYTMAYVCTMVKDYPKAQKLYFLTKNLDHNPRTITVVICSLV